MRGGGGGGKVVGGQGPPRGFERAGTVERGLGARQRGVRPGVCRVEVADAG